MFLLLLLHGPGRGAAKGRDGEQKSEETVLNKGGQRRTRVYGEAVP